MPRCTPQLPIRSLGVHSRIVNVIGDCVKYLTLFTYDMCYVPEQLVQFRNTLLDVPDLGLSFYNQ